MRNVVGRRYFSEPLVTGDLVIAKKPIQIVSIALNTSDFEMTFYDGDDDSGEVILFLNGNAFPAFIPFRCFVKRGLYVKFGTGATGSFSLSYVADGIVREATSITALEE